MDTHKISSLMAGILDTLKVIESSIELGQQTNRVRNLVSRTELDSIVAGAALVLRHLGTELQQTLRGEE